MMTREGILKVLQKNRQELRAFGVKRCGLFGSFVRNEANEDSDIDVLVEFEPEQKTFDNFMHLAFLLEDKLGRKVDLVTTESLSPYIGPYITKEVKYVAISS